MLLCSFLSLLHLPLQSMGNTLQRESETKARQVLLRHRMKVDPILNQKKWCIYFLKNAAARLACEPRHHYDGETGL